jgi:hypothetical protein
MEVNGPLLIERLNLGNFPAGGAIGLAANTIDIVAGIGINQTTAGQILTLPVPTDPRDGRSISVANSGTQSFTLSGVVITPNNYSSFEYHGGTWRSLTAIAASDYWRSDPADLIPDGVNDITEAIARKGQVKVSTAVSGDSGLTTNDLRGGTGVASGVYRTGIENGNTVTAIGVDLNGKIRLSNSLAVTDSRAVNTLPQDYPMGTYEEFKQSTTLGLTIPNAPTYVQTRTVRMYGFLTDFSGGPARQDIDLIDGRQYFRLSTSATTWGAWILKSKPASDFDMQGLLSLNGTAKVSLTGEVSWTNRFITMTAGSRLQETSGYHDVGMPPVGTAIPVSNGTTVVVTAATAGQTGLSGGIPLTAWQSLWYYAPRNTANATVSTNFRIQNYADQSAGTNGLNGTANLDIDSSEWVRICSRDDQNQFYWGTGDTTRLGYQFGLGMDTQEVIERTSDKGRYLANGYAFRPWNLTDTNAPSFGFTSYIRTISQGSNNTYSMTSGYRDIPTPTNGLVIYGAFGAANTAWRTNTANDAMSRMGEVFAGSVPATAVVMDFPAGYYSLFWAPDVNGGVTAGTWYITNYSFSTAIPPHWVFVAGRRDDDYNKIICWNGTALNRGDCLWRGNRDYSYERSRGSITTQGVFDCRWTQANFFAGTGANGLGTAGSTSGALVHWPNNTMMWGMDSSTPQSGGYIWLQIPSAGYGIPVLDAAGTRTRVVQTISGRNYVPLAQWETLVYIPDSRSSANTSVDRGWFVTNYGDLRNLPAHSITVASYAAPALINGVSTGKTRIKLGEGVYVQPGLSLAVGTPTYGDHATGTSVDWRPVVVAGQTPPAGVAALPAVTGVAAGTAVFRYMTSQSESRGRIEMAGYINTSNAIPDGTVIAFLPGVNPHSAEVNWLGVSARHAGNSVTPTSCFIVVNNATVGGQTGTQIQIFGYSAGNVTGGVYGPGGLVALSGLSFAHA